MPPRAWIQGPIRLCYKKISIAKKWSWENCLHVLSFPNSGNSSTLKGAPSPSSDSQSFLQWVWYSGVLYEICVHIRYAKWLSWGGFQLSSNLKTNRSIFVWIWILFMCWSRGLFLWMVQRKSRFRDLKRVDGTTQEFVSGTFRGCKFQSRLLAKYFILVNKLCSCSHINFVQTAVEEKLILCCVLNSPLERL